MANRYWVGGTGTWNTTSTTNWSATSGGAAGASVPTAADSVFFDQSDTYTVTMTGALLCLNITVSAGTVTFATGSSPTLTVSGSMSLITGTVWNSTGAMAFNATTAKTITTNGTSLSATNITFNGIGGTWTLGDALTTIATGTITLTAGTLALNDFTLTTGIFSSSNTNTRSINFGTGNIVLAHTAGGQTVLSMAGANGFTYTGTGGFVTNASTIRTLTFGSAAGGSTTNAPNVTYTGSGASNQTFTTGGWFNKLDFGAITGAVPSTSLNLNSLTLSSSGVFNNLTANMRGTGTIIGNGNTSLLALNINGTGITTTLGDSFSLNITGTTTLTIGTLNLNNFDLRTGIFSSSNTSTRSINFGTGNIVLTHTAGGGTLVLNMATATGFTYTGTGGFVNDTASSSRSFTFGTTGGTATNAPNLALAGSSSAAITLTTGSWFNKLDFGTNIVNPGTTSLNLRSLTLANGGTYTGLTATMVGTGTIIGNGNATLLSLVINGTGITTSLGDAFSLGATRTVTLTAGTLALNDFTLTTGIFSSSVTTTRAINFGTGNIALVHTTAATTVLSMATANGFTYTGTGGFTTTAAITRTLTFGNTGGGSATISPNVTLTGSGTSVITFTTGSWFNKLDFGTTAFNPGTTNLNLNGLTLSASGTFTGLIATMRGTGTIISNGNATLLSLFINGAGITTSLGDALTLVATGTTTLTAGTLALNDFTLTTGIFSSSNPNTRSINFGTSNIVLAHSTAGTTVLNMGTASNFTCTGTGGFVTDASITRTLTFGTTDGSITNSPNVTLTGSGTSVITFTTNSWFNEIDFGTTSFTLPTTTLNLNNLTLTSGVTFTGLTAQMRGTGTVISNGNATLRNLNIFNANGTGTTTLGDALTLIPTGTTTLTRGTLDLNGFTLTTGDFVSDNSNVRSINFGTGNIVLAHTTASTLVLNIANADSVTFTGTGGFVTDASISRSLSVTTLNISLTSPPNLSIISGSSSIILVSGSWFNILDFTGSTCSVSSGSIGNGTNVNTLILAAGGTYTSLRPIFTQTQTWTSQFGKQLGGIGVNGAGVVLTLDNTQTYITNSEVYLSAGTLDLGGYDLPAGLIRSASGATRSINFGSNNIILAHTTAATIVLDIPFGTNFTYTGTGGFVTDASRTRTFVFGTTGGSATNSPNVTFTGSGTAVQTFTTNSWFNTIDFGTTSFTLPTTTLNLNNLTLTSGVTFTGLTAVMRSTSTIITNGKTIAGFGINGADVTTTLGDALTTIATGTTTLTSGALDLNGFTLTTGIFSSSNSTTRSINFGTSNIILAHTTAGTTVLNMGTATNFTYTGTGGFVTDASITRTFVFGTTGGSATNSPNVTFTGSGTAVQTFTTNSWFNTIDFGTTSFAIPTTTLRLNNLSLTSSIAYAGLTANMVTTSTIYSNGVTTLGGLNIISVAGTTSLGDAFTLATNATTTLTSGTLDLNGFDLTTGIFASTGTAARSVIFGSNNIILAHTAAATTVLSFATATGFTDTGTGGFVTDASITRTLTFGTTGGSVTNSPNVTLTGSGTEVITFTTGSWFNQLEFGTTAFNPGTTNLNLNSLKLSLNGTFTTLTASMRGTGNITGNGNTTLGSLTINGTGITTTLSDAFTLAPTGTTTLTLGTLNLNGYDLITGIFSSSNTNVRSVIFGSNNIILAHTTAGTTVLNMGSLANFTYTGTGGFNTDASITRTVSCTGGSRLYDTNSPNLTLTGTGTSIITFTTGSWFNKLDFGTTVFAIAATSLNLNGLTLSSGGTFTNLTATMVGTGTIISSGNTTLVSLIIDSVDGTTYLSDALSLVLTGTFTLTSGTLDLNGFDLTTGIFSTNNSNARSISFGTNNIILAHTTAGTQVLSASTVTNFDCSGTGGFVTDASITRAVNFGSSSSAPINAPNLTYTGSGTSRITMFNGCYFNMLDYGTTTFDQLSTSVRVNSIVLSPTGSFSLLDIIMTGTGTVNTNNRPIRTLAIDNLSKSGIATLASAVTATAGYSRVDFVSGTLALAGFTLTTTLFSSTTSTTRTILGSRGSIVLPASGTPWSVTNGTGFTGSDYTIQTTNAGTKTFDGGGGSYGSLVQAGTGALTISGSNKFADILATTRPSTVTFTAGTTQTVNALSLAGTAGNLVTINSTTSGTQFTLSKKANGTINANYLSIIDSNVTGGATWYNNNGTNTVLTNNTGWNGTPQISGDVKGQFAVFF